MSICGDWFRGITEWAEDRPLSLLPSTVELVSDCYTTGDW